MNITSKVRKHQYEFLFKTVRMGVKRDGNFFTFDIDGKKRTAKINVPSEKKAKIYLPSELMSWFKEVAQDLGYIWGNPFPKFAKKEVLFMRYSGKNDVFIMIDLKIHLEVQTSLNVVDFSEDGVGADLVEVINDYTGVVHRQGKEFHVNLVMNDGRYYMVGRLCKVGVYSFGQFKYENIEDLYIPCDESGSPLYPHALAEWIRRTHGISVKDLRVADMSVDLERIFKNVNRPKDPQRLVQIGPFLLRIIKSRKWVFILTENGEKYAKSTYTPEEFAGREYDLLGSFMRSSLENIEQLLPQIEAILSDLI